MKKLYLYGVFVSCLILISSVRASVINYDESVVGDLAGNSLGSLGIGVNTISGSSSTSGVPFSTSTTDNDDFTFNLAAGTSLIDANITYSNVSVSGSDVFAIKPSLLFSFTDLNTVYNQGVVTNLTFSLWDIIIPFSPNDPPFSSFSSYTIALSGWSRTPPAGSPVAFSSSWDYTLTLEVAQVPIPAAVWLFSSGLLCLLGISRQKKDT